MMRIRASLARLLHSERGAVAVETALVAPSLIMLSLGGFEVSNMVARQSELQSAMAEASSIALAVAPDTANERTTVRDVIAASADLTNSNVAIAPRFRCGDDTTFDTDIDDCDEDTVTNYVQIILTDTYTPIWKKFGIGSAVNYRVTRYVLLSQVEHDDDDD